MISSIHLVKHQCWSDLTLELEPFTVIVGPSGWGKSAIVRALDSFVSCSSGTARITRGAKISKIDLTVDEHHLSWIKSEKQNVYWLNQFEMPKAGRSCPKEILDILKLPVLVDESGEEMRLWLAKQFDSPSFIFDTPSTTARYFSSAIGASFLSHATRASRDDRAAATSKATAYRTQIATLLESDAYKFSMLAENLYAESEDGIADLALAIARRDNLLALFRDGQILNSAPRAIEYDDDALDVAFTRMVHLIQFSDALSEQIPDPLPDDEVLDLEFRIMWNRLLAIQNFIRARDLDLEARRLLDIEEDVIAFTVGELFGQACPFCGRPLESLDHFPKELDI